MWSECVSIAWCRGHRLNRIFLWKSLHHELGENEWSVPLKGMRTQQVHMRKLRLRERRQYEDYEWVEWVECPADYPDAEKWTKVHW